MSNHIKTWSRDFSASCSPQQASEREPLLRGDADYAELFSFFLELLRGVAEQFQAGGEVEAFQDMNRTLQEGHRCETGRDEYVDICFQLSTTATPSDSMMFRTSFSRRN